MKKWKYGEINPETGKVFGSYRANGKIQWYSLEAFNKRKKYSKDYYDSDKGKQYHKNWYMLHKDDHNKKSANAHIRAKEELPLNLLYGSIRQGAKRRNLEFEISIEFIYELWKKQKGLCFYTNIPMKYIAFNKDPFQVSIDRIDSSKGYTIDNVVLCCQAINYLKNDYTLEEFNKFLMNLFEALKLIP